MQIVDDRKVNSRKSGFSLIVLAMMGVDTIGKRVLSPLGSDVDVSL